jgi:hypothetical protein
MPALFWWGVAESGSILFEDTIRQGEISFDAAADIVISSRLAVRVAGD